MSLLKWLAKVAGSAIVVSLITLFTTWYVVSLVVANIFQQLELPEGLIPKVQFSDVMAGVFNKPQADQTKLSSKVLEPVPSDIPFEESKVPKGSSKVNGSPPPDSVDTAEVFKQDQNLFISQEDFLKKKEQLSTEDKVKIFNLVSPKLPKEDMQTISKLLENGMTNDGFEQIQTILQKNLNAEEYQELLAILTNIGR